MVDTLNTLIHRGLFGLARLRLGLFTSISFRLRHFSPSSCELRKRSSVLSGLLRSAQMHLAENCAVGFGEGSIHGVAVDYQLPRSSWYFEREGVG